MGTNLSSLKCQNCAGYAISDMTENANWICQDCNTIISGTTVRHLLANLGEEMVKAQDDLELYEELLLKYHNKLHSNHFMLLDIKQNMAMILKSLTRKRKILERRVLLCEELRNVIKNLTPGVSKLYAIALHECLVPFLELTQMEFNDKSLNKQDYVVRFQN